MAGERIRILQRRWCSVRGHSAPHSSVVEGDELRPWANTGNRGFVDEWEQTRVVEAAIVEPERESRRDEAETVLAELVRRVEFRHLPPQCGALVYEYVRREQAK